jgi:hypothetical protein
MCVGSDFQTLVQLVFMQTNRFSVQPFEVAKEALSEIHILSLESIRFLQEKRNTSNTSCYSEIIQSWFMVEARTIAAAILFHSQQK